MTESSEHAARPELGVVMPVREALPFLGSSVKNRLGKSYRDSTPSAWPLQPCRTTEVGE